MVKTNHYQVAGEVLVTTTGNIDNLDFEDCSVILMNNASLSTIRGLKAGYPGQEVSIVSIGAGQVNFSHQDSGSSAANRLINFVTSGITPLAAGVGKATYKYDLTTDRWRLINHNQGAPISIAFSAGNFTASGAMTWTVDAGDIFGDTYYLQGRLLTLHFSYVNTTVGGVASTELRKTYPNGYISSGRFPCFFRQSENGNITFTLTNGLTTASDTYMRFYNNVTGAAWALTTNLTTVEGFAIIGIN